MRQAEQKLESIKKTDIGMKMFKDLTAKEIMNRDIQEIFEERAQLLKRSKKEDQEKLRKQERNVSYLQILNLGNKSLKKQANL